MTEQQAETAERAGRGAADLPEQQAPAADVAKVEDVEESNTATIDMTLTSAACPLQDVIEDQTASVLTGSAGVVRDYQINWVWMPPWGPEKITDDGREQLRALGFTV